MQLAGRDKGGRRGCHGGRSRRAGRLGAGCEVSVAWATGRRDEVLQLSEKVGQFWRCWLLLLLLLGECSRRRVRVWRRWSESWMVMTHV